MTTFKMSPLKALFLMAILAFAHSSIAVAETIESEDLEDIIDRDLQLLLTKAKGIALPAIAENGQLYPFGLVLDNNREVSMVGYTGDRSNAPAPEHFTIKLLQNLRDRIVFESDLIAAAVVRIIELPAQEGDKDRSVPGIGVSMDHHDGGPVMVFIPFLEGDMGKHTIGNTVTLPSRDYFFVQDAKSKE